MFLIHGEAPSGSGERSLLIVAGDATGLDTFILDDWNESDHPRAESGEFGSGGGNPNGHKTAPESSSKAAYPSEKEARALHSKRPTLGPLKHNPASPPPSSEGKTKISVGGLQAKLKGMPTEKLRDAVKNKDIDPAIKAHISRELTNRLLNGADDYALDYASVRSKMHEYSPWKPSGL